MDFVLSAQVVKHLLHFSGEVMGPVYNPPAQAPVCNPIGQDPSDSLFGYDL